MKITGFVGILEDITERKEQRRKIIEQQALMVHSAKLASIGEMAAGIAHEINNPLLIISGKVQQIRRAPELGKLDPDQNLAHTETTKKTVDRIAKIISGMRNFARDSSADPYTAVSVTKLLQEVVSFSVERFENQGVDLIVKVPALDFDLQCRTYQISQVLLDLLNNAFDAAVDSKNGLKPWVEISVDRRPEGKVGFRVKDSGDGVPEGLRSKIMDPFFTTKQVVKGTGLGLSISKNIIKPHSGELFLNDQHEETCFCVVLPLT
ncbi:MAG: hypothetical protein H7301_00075 [Cryobacterium sp.]|nr:hypothetical protein [Oligoflexia bacterium]